MLASEIKLILTSTTTKIYDKLHRKKIVRINIEKCRLLMKKPRESSANSDEITAMKWRSPLTEIYDKLYRKETPYINDKNEVRAAAPNVDCIKRVNEFTPFQ
jgi:hypothetical protein